MKSWFYCAALLAGTSISTAALAQSEGEMPSGAPVDTVFDDNWVSIGIGAGLGPSYSGSDDYVVFPLPVIQGSLGGIGITPRPAGLALDLIPDGDSKGPRFALGPSFRLRNDRADQIEDEVVELAGELDRAFEIGPSAGISFPALLNPFDSLTVTTDVRWDVAGAHDGMVIEPSVTYFTPLSRGMAASLSLSGKVVDDDFAEYYYSVTPAQSLASGLPQFDAEGGLASLGANLLVAVDLDGDLANGGFSIVAIGGYSKQMNDAKDTPYTAIRGDADQWLIGGGIAYTF